MCDPSALIGLALGVAQTVTGYAGEQQAAAQHNAMVRQNQEAAQANLRQEYTAVQTRQLQEEDAAAVEKQSVSREARGARATAMVAAGESGVSGLSVDALLADIYGKEAEYKDRVTQNTGFTTQNLTAEMQGLRAKAQDRINSIPTRNGPNPLAAALKIGSSALGAYDGYRARLT